MLSFIITFFLIAPYLTFKDKNSNSKYLTYSISIAISYTILGLLSAMLIFLKLTFLPIYNINLYIFYIYI